MVVWGITKFLNNIPISLYQTYIHPMWNHIVDKYMNTQSYIYIVLCTSENIILYIILYSIVYTYIYVQSIHIHIFLHIYIIIYVSISNHESGSSRPSSMKFDPPSDRPGRPRVWWCAQGAPGCAIHHLATKEGWNMGFICGLWTNSDSEHDLWNKLWIYLAWLWS